MFRFRNRAGAVLSATLAVLAACASADRPDADTVDAYESSRYGFSIEFPNSRDLREYSPDFIAIGRASGEAFTSVAEVVIEAGESESFEAFAVERARQACAADGPDLSLQCTRVERLQPFAARSGAEGLVFYLRNVATRPGTDEVVEVGGRGPFFVFDVSPGGSEGTYRALFVRAPVALAPDEADAEFVRRIALSLRRDPGRGER